MIKSIFNCQLKSNHKKFLDVLFLTHYLFYDKSRNKAKYFENKNNKDIIVVAVIIIIIIIVNNNNNNNKKK